MDSNDETNDTGKQSNNESSDATPQPQFNSSTDVATNQNKSGYTEKHTGKIEYWKEYGKKWVDPLVIVTIILAIATYMLYRQATKESKTAEHAAKSAKIASDAAVQALSENRRQFNILNQSAIRFDYMCFAYTPDFSNKPITPGHEMNILFYVSANPRPIHMYYYRIAFVFADTTKDRIDSLRSAMKNTSDMNPLDKIIGIGTQSLSIKELLLKSPTSTDSIRFNEGKCLFALRIEYWNDVSNNWNKFLAIATLRNKFNQESFTDTWVDYLNLPDKGFKIPTN